MAVVAEKVPFFSLCVLLDKISSKQGNENKKRLFKDFLDEWRSYHTKLHADDDATNDSFYPALRLLLPQLEREREAYGIKEHTMAKHFIELLGLGKDSQAAQKLINYRNPKNVKGDAGDFASVAYYILKPRCPDKGTMSIAEVNDCLDKIASCNAAKNKDGLKKALMTLIRNQSARELRWLTRMMMKELKIGLSQASILGVFHQDAEDLYNVKMSLEKVCTMLKDPSARLHELEIAVFSPFRPMLGDRASPHKIETTMNNKSFFLETKFDGERMQLHKKGDEYKYFSRGGHDYTSTYGATPFDGNFSPAISNCFKVESCILDGEMIGYNPETKTLGSKGEGFDIKSKDIADYQPMLCVFDILAMNGKVLSNKSLRERKRILDNDVFNPLEGRLVLSEYKEARTKQECIDALNEAIDGREEGIMVKDPDSVYKPNTRKGGWYKIKPEYVGGLMDELDLIVVGGYMGVGRRAGLMSHFLCALAVPPEDPDDKPSVFHSFCRVGSGYSRKELFEFNQKLEPHWQMYKKSKPPAWLHLASGDKQRPDACIHPSKSAILQIKAAEITNSDQFKSGCTLRFPRVEKIRMDKAWHECMSTKEMKDLRQKSDGKLAGQLANADEEGEPSKKRRKIFRKAERPSVLSQFKGIDVSCVTKVSELLSGKELCVINGTTSHSKSDLETKILECGGSIAQNPGSDTYCVIADKVQIKVNNLIRKGSHDIVRSSWLLKCVDQSRLIPWSPSDMVHTSATTKARFSAEYDSFGDSFFNDTSVEELRETFTHVNQVRAISSEEMADVEMTYFPHDSHLGLFRLCRVYMDCNSVVDDPSTSIQCCPLDLSALDLRFHGAKICENLESASHVVVHTKDLSRVKELRNLNKLRRRKFHMVTEHWVKDCIEEEKILNERRYDPPAE
ncbi:hypothetical protein CAPTEDRAFT_17890 [Capitella teleta]|uniref:DNA ligase n=1 Tax=Capitella teleta TaxID=283909 RepID=R7UVV7_CAPTE|nr:hypothetical protein CAPTEDRAFT_17890 [Capitella teleta]|eukprot:ELU10753.1 hypothetical protein CAPTEDRAFT_17890 [Capitella teleta]